jgi:hypothetical protein
MAAVVTFSHSGWVPFPSELPQTYYQDDLLHHAEMPGHQTHTSPRKEPWLHSWVDIESAMCFLRGCVGGTVFFEVTQPSRYLLGRTANLCSAKWDQELFYENRSELGHVKWKQHKYHFYFWNGLVFIRTLIKWFLSSLVFHLLIIARVKRIPFQQLSNLARSLSLFFVWGCWAAELSDEKAHLSFAGLPEGLCVLWEACSCRPVAGRDIAIGLRLQGVSWSPWTLLHCRRIHDLVLLQRWQWSKTCRDAR